MRNSSIRRKGLNKSGLFKLPTGVNEREKEMFVAFALSVRKGIFNP